jgi:predicted phosphodiesterase
LIRPASYLQEVIASAAQFCFERREEIDAVIVTGDLATSGDMIDIAPAANFVRSPAAGEGFYSSPRQPTISFIPDILLVPGNHDKYANILGTPSSKTFELTFEAYMPNFEDGVGHWVDEKDGASLAFVYADFSLLSRSDAEDKVVAPFGQGRVYAHVRDELVNRTLYLRQKHDGAPIVWLIHFAPFDCGYKLRLIDFSDVEDAAHRLAIPILLSGHVHQSRKLQRDGRVIYCSGSTGCVDTDGDSRIQTVHIDVDDEIFVERENFIWDREEHEFLFLNTD